MLAGVVLAALLLSPATMGAKIILKISMANPLDKAQTKEVRSNLPPGVGTNAVLNLDGLDLRYDVKQDLYYVYKKVDLPPKAKVDYLVEIRDIWLIAEEEMDLLGRRADALAEQLDGTDFETVAIERRDGIQKDLEKICATQKANTISAGTPAVRHIRVYHTNKSLLEDVRTRIGELENLVLATGGDPGELIGVLEGTPEPNRDVPLNPEEYREAVIRIVVRNTSPTVTRTVDIKRALPTEITSQDVLNADGLQITTDVKKGITYVVRDDVELKPEETLTYNVRIRDKWNINRPRCVKLRESASNLLVRVAEAGGHPSMEGMLTNAMAEISAIEREPTPTELNARYVAFFREQAERLDRIERRMYRVEAALRPVKKRTRVGFQMKPPSEKSTWLIIYIILGFLLIMSLVFYFRWYPKSKAERMDEGGGG